MTKKRSKAERELECVKGLGHMSDRMNEDQKLDSFLAIFHPEMSKKDRLEVRHATHHRRTASRSRRS